MCSFHTRFDFDCQQRRNRWSRFTVTVYEALLSQTSGLTTVYVVFEKGESLRESQNTKK